MGVGSAVQATVNATVANTASAVPVARVRREDDIEVTVMRTADEMGLTQCCSRMCRAPVGLARYTQLRE